MKPDYVCGRDVKQDDARFFSDYGGNMYFFCSPECKRQFDDHPDHYIREYAKSHLDL